MVLLSTVVLPTDQASETFGLIPGTYSHLLLHWQGRATGTAGDELLLVRFNGDTANNYEYQEITTNAGTTSSRSSTNVSGIAIGYINDDNVTANNASQGQAQINGYTTAWRKTLTAQSALIENDNVEYIVGHTGHWKSTAAITSLTVLPTTASMKAGTVLSLYALF